MLQQAVHKLTCVSFFFYLFIYLFFGGGGWYSFVFSVVGTYSIQCLLQQYL